MHCGWAHKNFLIMKNVKFSLSNIEGKLSRVEMQQIVGGSGGSSSDCDPNISESGCPSSKRVYNSNTHQYFCCHKRDVRLSQ